ncbi:DUF1848 family protein [Ralstonia pseudosolanacearum]
MKCSHTDGPWLLPRAIFIWRWKVILNTGGRTDTVQYYTQWLLKRIEEGYVMSRNPLFPNLTVS